MDHLTLTNQSQGLEPLSPEVIDMAQAIYKFSFLRSYPLSDVDIVDWAKLIIELRPNDTPESVSEAIKKLISGEIYYDKQKGIGNLIYALKVLDGSDFTDQL